MMHYIYYLTTDYDNNEIKYIGITNRNLEDRLWQHKYRAIKSSKPNKNQSWILSRLKKNQIIKIILIESFETNNIEVADSREIYWINYYKELGIKLNNSTIGGKYVGSYWKGKKQTKKHSENIRKSLTGRKLSKEHCETMRINKINHMVNNKHVLLFDENGIFRKEYKSCGSVARELNVGRSQIIKLCNLKYAKLYKNFIVRYKSLYDEVPNKIEFIKKHQKHNNGKTF